jgi:hypothetical protein
MQGSAPDLEWPGAQNSYHAPGVPEGAANLTIPAPGQVRGEKGEAGRHSAEKETRLLCRVSRG